jgi:hypothetical protein
MLPVRMFWNDYARMKVCGISKLGQSKGWVWARNSVQHSCGETVEQKANKQAVSPVLAATRQSSGAGWSSSVLEQTDISIISGYKK